MGDKEECLYRKVEERNQSGIYDQNTSSVLSSVKKKKKTHEDKYT